MTTKTLNLPTKKLLADVLGQPDDQGRYRVPAQPTPPAVARCTRSDGDCFYCTSRACPASPYFGRPA